MKLVRIWAILFACVTLLGLTGCKTTPEDIEAWKKGGNVTKLVGALNDSQQFIRLSAIEALVELDAQEATPGLAALFTDSDQVIVHKSIKAVAALGDPSLEPFMLPVLKFETAEARTTAATALGNLKSQTALQPLIEALNDSHPDVIAASAEALGTIGDPAAIPALTEKTGDSTFNIRFAAVQSIAQIGGPDSIDPLVVVLGDFSEKVRLAAIQGLTAQPDLAGAYAIKALRSPSHLERSSALLILKETGQTPKSGADQIWHKLASWTMGEKPKIDPAKAEELVRLDHAAEVLLEAVILEDDAVRSYAILALELIGEPVAADVATQAGLSAKANAIAWYKGRNDWPGAPNWKIDLWGGLTALDPAFELNKRTVHVLENGGIPLENMLKSKQFKAEPELIPLLIGLFRSTESDDKKDIEFNRQCRKKIVIHLKNAGKPAILPLLTALDDEDISISTHAIKTLVQMDDPRAKQAIIDTFNKRRESGENLAGTEFFDTVVELNWPELEEGLLKIRPNAELAIRTAEKKYSGIRFSNIPLQFEVDLNKQVAPFRLNYLKDGKSTELKVIFRPDENGNWVPTPPLPDDLG
jgi:HEAT repeat protein